eukprot:g1323.t1
MDINEVETDHSCMSVAVEVNGVASRFMDAGFLHRIQAMSDLVSGGCDFDDLAANSAWERVWMGRTMLRAFHAASICYRCASGSGGGISLRDMLGMSNFSRTNWRPESHQDAPVLRIGEFQSPVDYLANVRHVSDRIGSQLKDLQTKLDALQSHAKKSCNIDHPDFDRKNPKHANCVRQWCLAVLEMNENLTAVDCGRYECRSAYCRSQFDALGFATRTLDHQRFGLSVVDAWYTEHAGRERDTQSTETIRRFDPLGKLRFTSESLDDLMFLLYPEHKESKAALKALLSKATKSDKREFKQLKSLENGYRNQHS